MIAYNSSAFGLRLLLRVSGSAVYRATIPGLFSVVLLILLRKLWYENDPEASNELGHPYAVGILVASVSFLLIFRAQSAYARYWEASGAVHQMMSKWMDAVSHAAAYHMQSSHYDHIKPPSFFNYHELNALYLTRDREDDEDSDQENAVSTVGMKVGSRAVRKSIESVRGDVDNKRYRQSASSLRHILKRADSTTSSKGSSREREPYRLEGAPRLDGNLGNMFKDGRATYVNPRHPGRVDIAGFGSHQGGRTPSLFLQEVAHLASLTVAVAFASLRNDIEGSESPLGVYEPGSPWPEVDPEKDKNLLYHNQGFVSLWYKFRNFVGFARSSEERTRYNASRPLPVIGGVSEGEIRFLQMARGPYAKTQLCWYWLSEFIIREHLAGSTGKVGPPIISRIIQFLSDGMIFYNHARKIMFIPFPFPHAQLTAVYSFVMVPAVAFLMDQYTDDLWLGCVLTFLTVTVLTGIHEVARELENPFRNVPNELPLVTFMAQYNEALLTMFSGYHPDAFWAESADEILGASKNANKNSTQEADSSTPQKAATDSKSTTEGPSNNTMTDEKMRILLEKIEQQGKEIERLRAAVTGPSKEI